MTAKGASTNTESANVAFAVRLRPRHCSHVSEPTKPMTNAPRDAGDHGPPPVSASRYARKRMGYTALSITPLDHEHQLSIHARNGPNAAFVHAAKPAASGYAAESSAVMIASGTDHRSVKTASPESASSGPPARTISSWPNGPPVTEKKVSATRHVQLISGARRRDERCSMVERSRGRPSSARAAVSNPPTGTIEDQDCEMERACRTGADP